MKNKILEIKDLSFSFHTYGGIVRAVRGVDLHLEEGEILGIVGESGCGKSVMSQCILQLNPEPPGFFEGGSIVYKGEELLGKTDREMQAIRSKEIGFVFQDPMTSLNPTMKIGQQITEVFVGVHGVGKQEAKRRALETMQRVGISDVEKRFDQYPHQLSGGMRQRIMIAIALIAQPSIIIADEPTTSLDVTIEAQIIDLLLEFREEFQTSVMLITHDLGVIAKACDRVIVMYGGKVMESGMTEDLFYRPRHPYTRGLLHSIARPDMSKDEELHPIEGTPPDLFSPPLGCPFAARCEQAMQICYEMLPEEYIVGNHRTRCWLEHEFATPRGEHV